MTEVKTQCPSHIGGTGGTDSFLWNTDKKMGTCMSCGLKAWEHKGTLYGKRNSKDSFKIKGGDLEVAEVQEDDGLGYTTSSYTPKDIVEGSYKPLRGVTEETMREFSVVFQKNAPWKAQEPSTKQWEQGEADQYFFPYPSGQGKIKRTGLPKDHFAHFSSTIRSYKEFFGQNKFPAGCSKKVTITEGELDTLSAWQMLQSGRYLNPVVSLPSANPAGKFWDSVSKWLDSFDEIILSVDNDGPGKKIAEKISLMFPGKVKTMDHGQYKDANDFLMNGDAQAYKNAWWNAKRFRPDDMLVDVDDYLELYDESPDFEYFPTGIPQLDEKILGINKGYFTVIQAPTGVGKSEFMRYLEWQCLTQSDFTFGYMHLEESRLRSLLGLVSYKLGENVTLKKFIDEKGLDEEVRKAIKELVSSERMIQFNYNPEDGYESLIDKIKYLVAAFEVDYVFFEPIQDLVNGEDKEGKLADLSSRLGTLASDLGVGIVTIAHQNANGDTMYASMIGKKAAFEILLERDQEAEDLTTRNRTFIKVGRKNRVGLGNGPAGSLDFDGSSYTLIPVMPPKEPKVEHKYDF